MGRSCAPMEPSPTAPSPPWPVSNGARRSSSWSPARGGAPCDNGAVEYALRAETVRRYKEIPAPVVAETIERLRSIAAELRFAVEHTDGFVFEDSYLLGRWDAKAFGGRPVSAEELAGRSGTKLLALHPDADPDSLAEKAAEAVGD